MGKVPPGSHAAEETQANVALSSVEAEMNTAVKGMSEGASVRKAIKELFGEDRRTILSVVREQVNHSSTKQPRRRVQGAIHSYGVQEHKVRRAGHISFILTPSWGV